VERTSTGCPPSGEHRYRHRQRPSGGSTPTLRRSTTDCLPDRIWTLTGPAAWVSLPRRLHGCCSLGGPAWSTGWRITSIATVSPRPQQFNERFVCLAILNSFPMPVFAWRRATCSARLGGCAGCYGSRLRCRTTTVGESSATSSEEYLADPTHRLYRGHSHHQSMAVCDVDVARRGSHTAGSLGCEGGDPS
jgi:hypothetical protein